MVTVLLTRSLAVFDCYDSYGCARSLVHWLCSVAIMVTVVFTRSMSRSVAMVFSRSFTRLLAVLGCHHDCDSRPLVCGVTLAHSISAVTPADVLARSLVRPHVSFAGCAFLARSGPRFPQRG